MANLEKDDSSSSAENYFQFPLYLLAYDKQFVTRLEAIVRFCVVTVGRAFRRGRFPDPDEIEAGYWFEESDLPLGFDYANQLHQEVGAGMHVLHMTGGDMEAITDSFNKATRFIEELTQRHGPSPLVRIRDTFVWDVLNGEGLTYRELSILCAVYSVIGNKTRPVRITRDQIIARSMGYKTARMMMFELSDPSATGRTDHGIPWTTDQIRWTLDNLENRRFFARCVVGKRKAYFSHRMTRTQMHEHLIKQASKPSEAVIHREEDRDLSDRIKEAKRAATANRGRPANGSARLDLGIRQR